MTCAHQDDDWRTTMLSAAQFCGYASAWGTQRDTERERARDWWGSRIGKLGKHSFRFFGVHTHIERQTRVRHKTGDGIVVGKWLRMQFNLFQLQQNYYDRRQSAAAAAAISFFATLSISLSPPLSFSHISLSVKLFINKFWREETKRSKRQFQLNRHALPLPHPLLSPCPVQFAHEMKMLLLLLMLPPTGQPSSGSCVCCLTTIATASKLAPNLQLSGRNAPPA